jgi:hypothetical protein
MKRSVRIPRKGMPWCWCWKAAAELTVGGVKHLLPRRREHCHAGRCTACGSTEKKTSR